MTEEVPGWNPETGDSPEIGILGNHLDRAFPFHFAINLDLTVIQAGRTLRRMVPSVCGKPNFSDLFSFSSPKIPMNFSAICEQRDTVYFLASKQIGSLILRGQFLQQSFPDAGIVLLFIGSPVVREMESIVDLGLGLNDFAIHDAVLDMMLLLQSKNNTILDTKTMAEQLRSEVVIRRHAEEELKKINSNLEKMVQEATTELAEANQNLRDTVGKLRQRNEFMTHLNQMSDRLQACSSIKDSYQIVSHTMQMLYPGSYGVASFHDPSSDNYVPHAKWGLRPQCSGSFKASECPALAQNIDNPAVHIHNPVQCPLIECDHICLPMVSHEKLMGVLHVGWEKDAVDTNLLNDEGITFLKSTGEHIALAVSNLNLQETLLQQSTRDPLTGLFNRRYMDETLSRELQRAKRDHAPVGLIMLDVDHFKRINDSYGHDLGDEVLTKLAGFLRAQIRGEDIVCRYGGEEFFLILPGASVQDTYNRARHICNSVSERVVTKYKNNTIEPLTLSLGVACYPDMGDGKRELIKLADDALYLAKRGGRNRVELAMHNGAPPGSSFQ